MNANSDTGKQIMRFQEFADYSDEKTFKMANLGNVTVEWGELNIGMHSAMSAGTLTVVGEKAIFSSTGLDSGSEIGTTRFSSIDFQSGTIRFDLSKMPGRQNRRRRRSQCARPHKGNFPRKCRSLRLGNVA